MVRCLKDRRKLVNIKKSKLTVLVLWTDLRENCFVKIFLKDLSIRISNNDF
jgi:hypothetical protein